MGGPLAGQIAIFGAGTLPITWTRAVNHWFDARKGLALGSSLMGTGIFGFFLKRFTTWLIGQLGWLGVCALTFLNSHGVSTVTEVASSIGVPRTTSYRLLETLAAEGHVGCSRT